MQALGLEPIRIRCRKHAQIVMKIEENGVLKTVYRCQKHFFKTIESFHVKVFEAKPIKI